MVISLIFPRKQNPLITKLVDIFFTPLTLLDEYIKTRPFIAPYYDKFIPFFITGLDKLNRKQMEYVYISFQIIPRSLLIIVFTADVFYYHKLEHIYQIILLGILPLMHRYIKYSIKKAKELYIKNLELTYVSVFLRDKNYITEEDWEYDPDKMIYHLKDVELKEWFEILHKTRFGYEGYEINYDDAVTIKTEVYLHYKEKNNIIADLKKEDYKILRKNYYDTKVIIIMLGDFTEKYSSITEVFYIKVSRIIIFSLYCICWSTILFVSYKESSFEFLMFKYLIEIFTYYIKRKHEKE